MMVRYGNKKKAGWELRKNLGDKLKKKYYRYLECLNAVDNLAHIKSDKIWICWLQGLKMAPALVKRCVESICQHFPDKEIIILDYQNLSRYVSFPDYIWEKHRQGRITATHFSDLIRLEVLITYGGLWLDSTVFCTDRHLLDSIQDLPLFMYTSEKRKNDIRLIGISNWLIYAKTNNRLLMGTRQLLHEYWKQERYLKDYFLFHLFFNMAVNFYEEDWLRVPVCGKGPPHRLQMFMFQKYDKNIWNQIVGCSSFHKLTYKVKDNRKIGTFFERIVNGKS